MREVPKRSLAFESQNPRHALEDARDLFFEHGD
jgi:hypothetical protein